MSPSRLSYKDSCPCSWTFWAARLLSWGCDWQQTLSRSRHRYYRLRKWAHVSNRMCTRTPRYGLHSGIDLLLWQFERKWLPQCTYRLIAAKQSTFKLEQCLFQWRSLYSKCGQQSWISKVPLVYATVPQSKNGWCLALFTACSLTEDSASSVKTVTNKIAHPKMVTRAKSLHRYTKINCSWWNESKIKQSAIGLCGTVV